VSLQFQDGTLRLSGEAPAAWIKQLSEQNIPGVDSIDMQALRPLYPAHWHSWEALLAQLHKEPGYRITGSQAQAGRYVLEGRKDPLARDLKDIAGEDIYTKLGLQTAWEPYLSIEPEIVLKRAVQTLDIPATVTPQLVGERLVLTGQADQRWVAKVSAWPEAIVGIDTIDATRVKPLDADRQAYAAAARAIHAVVFYFASAQASLPPDPSFLAAIERVRDQYHRLSAKAAAIGQRFRIQVIGYTDHRGDPQRNRELQQERALFILERLVQAGIPRATLVVGAAGDGHSPESARRFQSSMRKVELRVQDP
jgi:OOP family OmpA-OmpF porin